MLRQKLFVPAVSGLTIGNDAIHEHFSTHYEIPLRLSAVLVYGLSSDRCSVMDSSERQTDAAIPRVGSQRPGTPLVHFGLTADETSARTTMAVQPPVAVLVCHGMGQQVRYETISSIAEAIRTEAAALGGNVSPVEVHLSSENNSFLARAELNWTDANQTPHTVHVYEAYWAPLTEGRVSYWNTVKFLLSAAWNGLRYSRLFRPSTFERWMFEGQKLMKIGPFSFLGILGVLVFLLLQVGIIGYVLMELAQQYKLALSQPAATATTFGGFFRAWLHWLVPFFPGHQVLFHPNGFGPSWWRALACFIGWILLLAEAFVVRYFLIEFVGDVAAYISPYKDSKFDEIRHQIQKVGLDVGKVIYGFGPPQPTTPQYTKIVIAGHSLGSVLAYDTLNALINQDNVSAAYDQRGVVQRTRALLTFGSPLDKTAFIFRMQARNNQAWIREQLAASVQPLIVSYELYRKPFFDWINIWSPMDIISGELNYYDDPARPPNLPPCVQNMVDPKASIPLYAHVQYWGNPLLRKQLYRLVS